MRWERAFREQSVMCNQAAGLSRCLTKVQDSMVTQLKSLRVDKTKGKTAERTQQAVDELILFGDLQPVNFSSYAAYDAGSLRGSIH